MEHNGTKQIEELLKKVFVVHRDTIKAANTNVNKYKQTCQRVVDKNKQLEKDVEDLTNENKNLKVAISTQTRPGSCCEVIRQSLETVIVSYKQLLAEKDTRIRQLELQLKRLTGGSMSYSLMTNPGYQLLCLTNSSDKPNVVPNHSPDSTSVNINEEVLSIANGKIETKLEMTSSGKPNKQPDSILGEITSAVEQEIVLSKITASIGKEKVHEIEDKELVFDDDSVTARSCIGIPLPKLSLQKRKRIQRSKYSEAESPEMKRYRHVSPIAVTEKTTDDCCSSVPVLDGFLLSSNLITTTKNNTVDKLDCEQNINTEKNVLVKDTCDLTLNEAVTPECIHTDNDIDMTYMTHNTETKSVRNNGGEEKADGIEDQVESNIFVIPETLAMDDCYTENAVDNVTVAIIPQWTNVVDVSAHMQNSCIKKHNSRGDSSSHKSPNHSLSNHIAQSSELDTVSVDKGKSLVSTKSGLQSPVNIDDEISHDMVSNHAFVHSDTSLVGNSDGDDDHRDTSSESCGKPANACKSMREIDDMFETPDGKVKMENKLKTNVKLPLFKKVANNSSKNTDGIILSHSHSKHKTNINQRWKSSLKNQQCCTDKTKAMCGTEYDGDNDVASQGHEVIESCCEGNIFVDQFARQSNVVPVNNDLPNSSKNVQSKKNKSEVKNDQLDVFREMGTGTMKNIYDETFKSPSMLHNIDGKCSNMSKDVKPNRRNSKSDFQLPFNVDKQRLIEVISIVDSPPTNRNKINIQQDLASLSTKRKSILKLPRANDSMSPTQDDLNGVLLVTGDKSKLKKTKGLHQLTLTQSFSSPMKKKQKQMLGGNNSDLQIAMQLSLQETKKSPCDNEVVDSSSQLRNLQFNKLLPQKNCRYKTVAKLVDHNGTRDTSDIGDDSVLREVIDQSHNIQLPPEPNGSIDPAAELTHLLMESESVGVCNVDHKLVCHLPKTSTVAVEESQDIPSSSTSYKFPPQRNLIHSDKQDIENRDQREHVEILENSFDRRPKKAGLKIAHVNVVRKKDERKKLQGYSCKQCLEFYKSTGRDEAEIRDHLQRCSRHRAQYMPPETPKHFWSIGFIDTQECLDIDEKNVGDDNHDGDKGIQSHRRRRKLNKYFKSKDESQ